MVGPAFITSHHPWQRIIEATVIAHPSMPFRACLSVGEEPIDNKLSGIQSLYHLLRDIVSSSRLRCDFLHITLWFSVKIVSTFCSLHFVVAILGQLL
jgi:hypothetical protein